MSRQEQPQEALPRRPDQVRAGDSAESIEAALRKLRVAVETASAKEPEDWAMRVAAAIRAVVEFAAADPLAADLLTLDSLAQGSNRLVRQGHPVDDLARLLAAGRDEHPEGEALPSLLEDALAGGIFMLLVQRLDAGQPETLAALAPDAIEFALTPYIGHEKAREAAAVRR
jgi:hypothetical protein